MLIAGLTMALTASKWITIGKILSSVGACCLTVSPLIKESSHKELRRTDKQLNEDCTVTKRDEKSYQVKKNIPLSAAINMADSTPGVYVLKLNGQVMKCGRASYDKGSSCGVAWRLRQYYNLNYDDRARAGDFWSVNNENRDKITVAWQCCPASKCHELEYKLFTKYGKGPWAHRAPANNSEDSWDLLI